MAWRCVATHGKMHRDPRDEAGRMKTTIHLDDELHRVLRLRAAEPGAPSMSDQINESVRRTLSEDVADAKEAVRRHRTERFLALEKAVEQLRRDGRL
jgi:hypothetical protein